MICSNVVVATVATVAVAVADYICRFVVVVIIVVDALYNSEVSDGAHE